MIIHGPDCLGPNPDPQITVADARLVAIGDEVECVFNYDGARPSIIGHRYRIAYINRDQIGIWVNLDPKDFDSAADAQGYWIDYFKVVRRPPGMTLADDLKRILL